MEFLKNTPQNIKDIYIKEPQNCFNSEEEAIASIIAGIALTTFAKTNDLQVAGALFLASAGSRKKGITNLALTALSIACLKRVYLELTQFNWNLLKLKYIKND